MSLFLLPVGVVNCIELKVNLAKSKLVPVGNVDDVDGLACWKRMSCPSFFSLWVLQTVLRSFSMNSYGMS
jgi:hypothetical protein